MHKIILFNDVKSGLFTIYVAEFIWVLNRLFKLNIELPEKIRRGFFETRYGKFYIHQDLLSTIAISPAFEREDVNYLLDKIDLSVEKKRKILFLDIGAYVGLYSVLVGNKYKNYKKLDIIAFEPSTDYLSEPTLELLKKNISINKINNVRVENIGIGSKKGKNSGNIKTDTLIGILGKKITEKYDEIYIKLDIDDFVIDGLKGIMEFIDKSKKTYLFIEDFIEREKTIRFLEKNNFEFEKKLTEYNSFWKK